MKSLVNVRVAKSNEFKSNGFHRGVGVKVKRERNDGEAVELDGRDGGGDMLDVRSSGSSVEYWVVGEDGDSIVRMIFENKLSKFHHGYQMAHARRRI